MPVLERVHPDRIPPALRDCYTRVSQNVADTDTMFQGNSSHYLTCGASALNVITICIALSGTQPTSILDFGSGAGRVTRWLRAAHPAVHLSATDIRESDVDFCAHEFGASTWVSGTDIDRLESPSTYDAIWVGSVLTHLSGIQSKRLLNRLLSWLNRDGVLIVSLHGRFALARGPGFGHYGVAQRWKEIEKAYSSEMGYGYANYPGKDGYGISIAKPSWSARLIEEMPQVRLLMFSELAWDGHHDVLAIQNRNVLGCRV